MRLQSSSRLNHEALAGENQAPAGCWSSHALTAWVLSVERLSTNLAYISPSFCDGLRPLDSTPLPCGPSRETASRSEICGYAGVRLLRLALTRLWGFRLHLLVAHDSTPIGYELCAADVGEREAAAEMLGRAPLCGDTVVADESFAGEEFEEVSASMRARLLRPDRKEEPRRFGSLGAVRLWFESVFQTCEYPARLERRRALNLPGIGARIGLRLPALAAGLWHNQSVSRGGALPPTVTDRE